MWYEGAFLTNFKQFCEKSGEILEILDFAHVIEWKLFELYIWNLAIKGLKTPEAFTCHDVSAVYISKKNWQIFMIEVTGKKAPSFQ